MARRIKIDAAADWGVTGNKKMAEMPLLERKRVPPCVVDQF
jgi:hypothetical protein